MRFEFGRAPRKLDLRFHLVFSELAPGEMHNFRCDPFSLEIFDSFDGRKLWHGQDPSGGLTRGFAKEEFANFMHLGVVLLNPIMACNAAVEIAMFNVPADLLRADQPDFQLLIIDVRDVRAAVDLDVESG